MLKVNAGEVQEALIFDVVSESLLVTAIFQTSDPLISCRLLAQYGVEVGGSRALRKVFHNGNLSSLTTPNPLLIQKLASRQILKLEDFCIFVVRKNDLGLLNGFYKAVQTRINIWALMLVNGLRR